MAKKGRKVKLRYSSEGSKYGRRVTATIYVIRTGSDRGSHAFEACATVGGFQLNKRRSACAFGKNPRRAIANAMTATGRQIAKRSGAFRGYGRK